MTQRSQDCDDDMPPLLAYKLRLMASIKQSEAEQAEANRQHRAPFVREVRDAFFSYNPPRLVLALVALAYDAVIWQLWGAFGWLYTECQSLGVRSALRRAFGRTSVRWRVLAVLKWELACYRVRRWRRRVRIRLT